MTLAVWNVIRWGEIEVPFDALYGSQTQRAIENFRISGLKPRPAFIWSMGLIKRAATEVNRDLSLLDAQKANSIIRAAQEVIDGKLNDQFVIDPFQAGAGTSHHMNFNEVIANRATQLLGGKLGEYRVHPNDHVNKSQSTNDVIPTAIRLGCLGRLDELLGVLKISLMRKIKKPSSSMTLSNQDGPICRMPSLSAWGRSLALTPGLLNAIRSGFARLLKG